MTRWPVKPLGAVAETSLGKMLDRGRTQGHGHVPYLRNVNVQWGRIDLDDVRTMEIAPEERSRFALRSGDLLVCEGGEIGRAAIWTGRNGYMAYQKALHRVRPLSGLDARFLLHQLAHAAQNGVLDSFATGSTIKHLPQQKLRKLPVVVPPLGEQRRIVDILEDHLSRLDATDHSLAVARARLAGLLEADISHGLGSVRTSSLRLDAVLGDPLMNGRSVPTADSGFPVLRLTALRGHVVDISQSKVGRWTEGEAAPYLVTVGDLLVSRGNGSLSLVGRGAIVPEQDRAIAFPDTMIRIRPDLTLLRPAFMTLVWNSRYIRRQIERMARTTAGIYKINQRQLGRIEIPIPSLSDQDRLIAEWSETQAGADRFSRHLADQLRHAQGLRRSLLEAAFSGRLTGSAKGLELAEEMAG